jgi:enoyl-CoA hydratase
VVPAADLLAEARRMAAALAGKAPIAAKYILEAVHHGMEMPLADGQFLEGTLFGLAASTEDMKEGTRAFLEKRQATWRGR